MAFLKVLIIFGVCLVSTKGQPVKTEENKVTKTGNTPYLFTREYFLYPEPDNSLKQFPSETENNSRQKRFAISAAAYGVHALRRQEQRFQNRLQRNRLRSERNKLRSERNKLRSEMRIRQLNDTNQKIKVQLDQWNMKQQINRQRHQQRWAEINKQLLYPMNFQEFINTQQKMQQNSSPVNFQQHQFPNKIGQPMPAIMPVQTLHGR